MKNAIFLVLFLCLIGPNRAQTIQNITMDPIAPDDNDSISFYVDLQFPYFSVGNSLVSVFSPNVFGVGNYCMGMLTMIHDKTDTLKIGPLPAGSYVFHYSLNAGVGGPPCSPPFVSNDVDTLAFTVSTTTNILESMNNYVNIFPNPSTGFINVGFNSEFGNELVVLNSLGEVISRYSLHYSPIEINLPPGVYFLKNENGNWTQKLLVIGQ